LKTRIATALSIVGVLGAGSDAALVNTSILEDGQSSEPPASLMPAPSAPVTGSSEPLPERVVTVVRAPQAQPAGLTDTRSAAATPQPSTPVNTPDSTDVTVFNVGASGTVTVRIGDGGLDLRSALPNAGWSIGESEAEPDEVEVDFVSDSLIVSFTAVFVDGEIATNVESRAVGAAQPATTPYEHDEYDEYDDEEDEDDD
jgi:hypothetical protein